MRNSISVLVCDDSALMRKLIRQIIEQDPQLNVVATAFNGFFALKKIPVVKPDVIILDLEMPEMNGIEFLKERKRLGIDIPVIILSSLARKGAKVTMEALELGASDFILKPSGSISRDIDAVSSDLHRLIHIYGGNYKGIPIHRHREDNTPFKFTDILKSKLRLEKNDFDSIPVLDANEYMRRNNLPKPINDNFRPSHSAVELVVIGISTGGPNALRQLLPELPKDFPVPILIVQHMPEGFTKEFSNSLNDISSLSVKEAENGDVIEKGTVYIAPGNQHLTIEKIKLSTLISLDQDEPVNGHRPSVDKMFESVSKSFGKNCLAVIMTGMGRDGARELCSLYNKGAYTLAQDQESCIVYGMPRVATESGYVETIASLSDMAKSIIKIVAQSL